MDGAPMEAVKKGALQVAEMQQKSILTSNGDSTTNTFDKFLTIVFDDRCYSHEFTNLGDYSTWSNQLRASSGTSFSVVFDSIKDQYTSKGYDQYEDCTIMFMTDGQTGRDSALMSLEELKLQFKASNTRFRFFCIGFSAYHDADLLGKIAGAGNELGNFVYIKETSPSLKEDFAEALNQAFELAPGASSVNVRIYQDIENGYSCQTRLNPDEENMLSVKLTMPLDALTHESGLKIEFRSITLDLEKIEKVSETCKDKCEDTLYLFNLQMFDIIIKSQGEISKEEISECILQLGDIDSQLNNTLRDTIGIKWKAERKQIKDAIQDLKQKVSEVLHFLRQKQLNNSISNDYIAKLNAMAYQGVRGGLQKKLDTRALKNEAKFNALNTEIENYVKTLDMNSIRETNHEIAEMLGDCFLTTKDVFECMEDED